MGEYMYEAPDRYKRMISARLPGGESLGLSQDASLRGGAISFEIDGIHPHDVSQVLDSRGIAVRAGHHCAKPAHKRFGVQSSTRMSSYLYTTPAEIDALWEQGVQWLRDAGAEPVKISLPHTAHALPTYYIIAPA